jgi:uncharacterized repeat protein (TIGR02543 family)
MQKRRFLMAALAAVLAFAFAGSALAVEVHDEDELILGLIGTEDIVVMGKIVTNKGITIKDRKLTVADGYSLNVDNSSADLPFAMKVEYGCVELQGSGTLDLNNKYGAGLYTILGGIETNITVTSVKGRAGVINFTGANITITGDAIGTADSDSTIPICGVLTFGGNINVGGNVVADGEESSGVRACWGGTVTVEGDSIAQGADSTAAYTASLGTVHVKGNAIAAGDGSNGAEACYGSAIVVLGDVTSSGAGSRGVYVYNGGTVTVNGNIEAAGAGSTGVIAGEGRNLTLTQKDIGMKGNLVTVNGSITAPVYIVVDGEEKSSYQGEDGAGENAGYQVYTGEDGSVVRVKEQEERSVDWYTVSCHPNGALCDMPVDMNRYYKGDTVKLLSGEGLTRPGYVFAGWELQDGTRLEDSFIMGDHDVTVFARWVKN